MLQHFLISQIYTFLLIFVRIGSGVMVMPGFSETYVPQTVRLVFVLMISLIMTPVLSHVMPPIPSSGIAFTLLILGEILIGVFVGTICQILIAVTHVAGMIFSIQAGVSSAVIFDVDQNSQGSLIGNFLGILTIVLLFTTDLHHMMLRGVTESYAIFVPGKFPPLGEFVGSIAHTVSDVFTMAVQIAAPLIITGTLLFLGAGVISRLMPTVQIFFVITAPQLLLGFFVFVTTFSAIMLFYLDFYREKMMAIMGYLK